MPTLRIEHLDENEVRLLRIGLNKLGETSEWNEVDIAAEFRELLSLDVEIDCVVSGFDRIEIDNLVHAPGDADEEEPVEVGEPGSAVTRLEDMWELGEHRILCGSSLDPANLLLLMAGELVRMVLVDQPFNLRIDGFVSGHGKTRHREFVQASGELSEAEFVAFLTESIKALAACCVDGALLHETAP